jgi:hypothetical protein
MELAGTPETSVNFFEILRCSIPEDSHIHTYLQSCYRTNVHRPLNEFRKKAVTERHVSTHAWRDVWWGMPTVDQGTWVWMRLHSASSGTVLNLNVRIRSFLEDIYALQQLLSPPPSRTAQDCLSISQDEIWASFNCYGNRFTFYLSSSFRFFCPCDGKSACIEVTRWQATALCSHLCITLYDTEISKMVSWDRIFTVCLNVSVICS